jgi:hypothetical protein
MMKRANRLHAKVALAAFVLAGISMPVEARNVRAHANTNVNRNKNVNVNRNVNRNTNVNVNRHVDVDVDHHYHGGYYGGCCYHGGVGTAMAVTATAMVTAAVIGSMVNTLPVGCTQVIVNGFAYQQCGSTWYQPQLAGSSTTYVVVNAPR